MNYYNLHQKNNLILYFFFDLLLYYFSIFFNNCFTNLIIGTPELIVKYDISLISSSFYF